MVFGEVSGRGCEWKFKVSRQGAGGRWLPARSYGISV